MTVLNKTRDRIPASAVYIGRPSKWGNPFLIGKDGDRAEVITKYEMYLYENTALYQLVKQQLKGKDLVCFCAPKACHGDVLHRIANAP